MDVEVIWFPKAEKRLLEIFTFIENEYGIIVAKKFANKILSTISTLSNYPNIGGITNEKLNIRYYVVSKQNTIIYQMRNKQLFILNLHNIRQDPKYKKY